MELNKTLIRDTYPNKIAAELLSVQPINIDIEVEGTGIERKVICLRGGPYHDFVLGFGFKPFRLVLVIEDGKRFKGNIFTLVASKELETIAIAETEEEFLKVKEIWEKFANLYNEKEI